MLDHKFDDDIFSNEIEYFFSLHGPRFEHMNQCMAESLGKKFGKEFRPIAILNAWPSKAYDKPNYIVLNKKSYKLAKELSKPVIYLPDYEDVNAEFSQDPFIAKIAKKLSEKQDKIFVYPFTTAFLDLPKSDFTILGSNNELAKRLDNKINQLKLFQKLGLPHNKARIFETVEDLLEYEYEIIPSYLSAAYTSGGNESGLIYSSRMLHEFLAKLRTINKKNSFIVSEIFEDIVLAPNVNALVTSDGQVFTLVLSDQILLGNRYLGNTYPSKATVGQKQEIYAIIEKIGGHLFDQGYVGLFGCDFLINKTGDLVIVDLNPRHQGGYVCNGLALQTTGLNLTDIELSALLDETVELSQPKLDKDIGFAWSHSKIVPPEKGQIIKSEFLHQEITKPFLRIGEHFTAGFYKKDSIFIDGYIGYQVQTAKDRDSLDALMLSARQEFDAKVLGL